MRSNASIAAVFLLLAGCVGGGRYSDFSAEAATPVAGTRGMAADDPYARPQQDPYAQPQQAQQDPYALRPPAQDPYAAPAPRQDGYAQPGAGYQRPEQVLRHRQDP